MMMSIIRFSLIMFALICFSNIGMAQKKNKKKAKTQTAIDTVGKAWLRDALMEQPSLEEFLV